MFDAQASAVDEAEFRGVYQATSTPLRAYLLHVCRQPDVADDLVQETWCRYVMRRHPVMDESQTRSWLFRVATNLLHDRVRSGADAIVPEVAERGAAPNMESRIDVRATLRQLKPRERELLWLAYVEGMNHKEIAAATGLRVLSIKILLFRARRKAAEMLKPQDASSRTPQRAPKEVRQKRFV
jgi:RNA polymerase sigma-70 factor (ECF subfamily)